MAQYKDGQHICRHDEDGKFRYYIYSARNNDWNLDKAEKAYDKNPESFSAHFKQGCVSIIFLVIVFVIIGIVSDCNKKTETENTNNNNPKISTAEKSAAFSNASDKLRTIAVEVIVIPQNERNEFHILIANLWDNGYCNLKTEDQWTSWITIVSNMRGKIFSEECMSDKIRELLSGVVDDISPCLSNEAQNRCTELKKILQK